MLILKRLLVWFIETLLEVLLLGLALVGLVGYDPHAFVKSLGFYVTGILLFSFTTGYLVTTVVARAVWRSNRLWTYSATAGLLYLFHSEIFFRITGGSTRPEQFSMQAAGTCVVFACSFVGTLALRRWTAMGNKLLNP
jgi:hypothetical protein